MSRAEWRPIFGHDEPYDEQADGIDVAIETARDGGYLALEGACGTGKTMLALTAGLHLVRDPDSRFERVLVLTSVKQQLRQFEEDLRTINDDLPAEWEPISGLTLVGKADVCPYSLSGTGDIDDGNVYERCEGLRERTRGLAEERDAGALAADARSQQVGLDGGAASYLSVDGEPTPYPPSTLEAGDTEYCPFYAGFLDGLPDDGDPIEAVPFDPTDHGMLEASDIVSLSASAGVCPHSAMGAILPHVEVVVGNYYHAFDPVTAGTFTGGILDSETFVVCDEAHMLEPRVRELVGDSVSRAAIREAEGELSKLIGPLEAVQGGDGTENTQYGTSVVDDAEAIRAELGESEIGLGELRRCKRFLEALREELDRRATEHLEETDPGWRRRPERLETAEIPLRDPETPETDELTRWGQRHGYDAGDWVLLESVGAVVGRVLNELEESDTQRAAPGVGRTLAAWRQFDHEEFFRTIDLERRDVSRSVDPTDDETAYLSVYRPRLSLHNCLPSGAIGEQLDAFGGGVLMSATLEPIDAFAEVTGLRHLESEGRPVVERTYGLEFPRENRASFAVSAPKFTYGNRGDPGSETPTRQAHARAIRQVSAVPGNVLVGMPSYREARWAAELLEGIEKPVLLDEASDDAATEELKQEFFDGEPKVLVTSLRGTLTEGVDYRGDRLSAAIVCGVPIIDTSAAKTRAVRAAYDRAFGDGFRYALAVPAVRKARQAVGRVIRGPEERGVRVLCDERYARSSWDSVRALLGASERDEFRPVSPDMLNVGLEQFRL
ncbi:MAG: ATP-dependent DNA helicase [Natronomonas sp.]